MFKKVGLPSSNYFSDVYNEEKWSCSVVKHRVKLGGGE